MHLDRTLFIYNYKAKLPSIYRFQNYKLIYSFARDIFKVIITLRETDDDQNNFVNEFENLSVKLNEEWNKGMKKIVRNATIYRWTMTAYNSSRSKMFVLPLIKMEIKLNVYYKQTGKENSNEELNEEISSTNQNTN